MYAGSRVIAAYIRCLHVSPVGNLHLAHRGRRSTRNPLRKINGWNLDVGKLAVLNRVDALGRILLELIQCRNQLLQIILQWETGNIDELLRMQLNVFNIIDFLHDLIAEGCVVGKHIGRSLNIDEVWGQ